MANFNFIFQGIRDTENSRNEIINLFSPTPSRLIFSTAYLRSNAILTLDSELSTHSELLTFFVGINNGNTSYQALMELFNRNITIYTIDTGSPNIIYHPKLYLAEYPLDTAKLIIGSSNFTGSGLTQNIEGNIVLEMNLNLADERTFFDSVLNSFELLTTLYPANVRRITNAGEINQLFVSGKLEDENIRRTLPSTASTSNSTITTRMSPLVPPVTLTRSPLVAPTTGPASTAGSANTATSAPTAGSTPTTGTLVWRKETLAQSDAQYIPPGSRSKRTGNLRLAQANFRIASGLIDKNTYFRNVIFAGLAWSWETPTKEVAIASFSINLAGTYLGTHNLVISHNINRIADQSNIPTVLHWGHSIGSSLQSADYRGYDLELYQITPTQFHINIH